MWRLRTFLYAAIILLVFGGKALASLQDNFTLNESELAIVDTTVADSVVYSYISLAGYDHIGEPGKPSFPVKVFSYAIPLDKRVSGVSVTVSDSELISISHLVYPAQPPLIYLEGHSPPEFVESDSSIYNSSNPFPEVLSEGGYESYFAGLKMANISVYPVRYIPTADTLILYTSFSISIQLTSSDDQSLHPQRRTLEGQQTYENLAKMLVKNTEDVGTYIYHPDTVDALAFGPLGPIYYVIITADSLKSEFEPLADWYIRKGVNAKICTLSWIDNNFDGDDLQEKIRGFISTYYVSYQTSGVLLGGSPKIVPKRDWNKGRFRNRDEVFGLGVDIPNPADLYYAALDGSWDLNDDQVYGDTAIIETPFGNYEEYKLIDYYGEVWVGRAQVSNKSEVQNFVNKILRYEQNPPEYDNGEDADFLFLGAYIDKDPISGEYYYGCEIKDSTIIHLQNQPRVFKVYNLACRRDEDISIYNAIQRLQGGFYVINHAGHGGWDCISIRPNPASWDILTCGDLDNLTNSPKYGVFSTIACVSAAFDTTENKCFGCHWLSNQNGGGVAFIGNSRIGDWLSDMMDEYYMEYLMDVWPGHPYALDDGFYGVGTVYGMAKNELVSNSQDPWEHPTAATGYMYAVCSWSLLGNPATPVWTSPPESLHASHPLYIPTRECSFPVHVTSGGSPFSGAWVCLYKDGDICSKKTTNGSGNANFTINLQSAGSLYVTVTKYKDQAGNQYIPYRGKAAVSQCLSGHISENQDWDGEILLCGDVTVDTGAVLTVKPGAVVRSMTDRDDEKSGVDTSKCELIVYGTLNISGTDTADVTITSAGHEPEAGDWHGIRVMDGGNADINRATIEYGYCGLRLHSGSIDTVKNCHITQNEVYGIRCETDDAHIYKNTIDYNERYGIYVHNHSPDIVDNMVANYPQSTPSYDIYCYFQTQTSSKIKDNELKGNPHGVGLYLYRSRPSVKTCTIKNNSIGIVAFDSEPVITDSCSLLSNQIGLSCDCLADPTFKRGDITNSTMYGVYCTGGSYPVIGGSSSDCCGITGSGIYHVYNDNHPKPDSVIAEWNCWGAVPPDSTKFTGPVDYDHYMSTCRREIKLKESLTENLPQNFSLSQNYPNPFNPTTVIKYALPENQYVSLNIYNLLGRVVTTLVDGQNVAGYYQVLWNGKNSSGQDVGSGVYFYRIKAGSFVRAKKLVLLR